MGLCNASVSYLFTTALIRKWYIGGTVHVEKAVSNAEVITTHAVLDSDC